MVDKRSPLLTKNQITPTYRILRRYKTHFRDKPGRMGMRSRELKALRTKFHGSIPDDKYRCWEIATETFLRFPWSTQEASMWKQAHVSSDSFRNKKIQQRPKT